MGALRTPSGEIHPLDALHRVGRADDADARIDDPHVSFDHARITWLDGQWLLEDLKSRNGTRLNGERITEQVVLSVGDRIVFGGSNPWQVLDLDPPGPWAIDPSGMIHRAHNGLLSLPSMDAPQRWLVCLDGCWILEGGGQAVAPGKHSLVMIDTQPWKLRVPRQVEPTLKRPQRPAAQVVIEHSLDEEHVEIEVRTGHSVRRIPHRAHSFLLLHLARLREQDAQQGHSPAECGWVTPDQLLGDLNVTRAQLNMMVYRARQQFAELTAFESGASVIARRRGSGQIRLDFQMLRVQPFS